MCLLLLCAGWCPARAQTAPAMERVVLAASPEGALQVQVNARPPTSLPELRKAGDWQLDGVRLSAAGDTIWVSGLRRPLVVEAPDAGEFRIEAPAGAAVQAGMAGRSVRVAAASTNPAPVRIEFADSGRVELPPGGSGVAEFFANRAYSFLGSTNVSGTTGDGVAVRFGRAQGPMLGGMLAERTDARGGKRVERSTPLVRIDFTGSPDREVQVQSAAHSGALVPGQERLLTFPNGAQAMLRHDPGRGEIQWRVLRGVCQFGMAGFSCWRAVASSGQAGALQWSGERRVADLKVEGGGAGFVQVQLSGRISASVAAGATFQYAQFQDCGSFSTGAVGDVALHDRESGETIPIRDSTISYNEGVRTGGAGAETAGTWHPVTLAWDSETRAVLRGGGTTYAVEAGLPDTLNFGGDALNANLGADGSLTLRAADGNFVMTPAFLAELSIDIPEGAALVLRLNRQRLVFTAESAPDSGAAMRVAFGGRTYMYLSGDARVTVVLGQNTLIPEANPAWLFFEGAGSENTFGTGPQPGVTITPPRIPQEPVSVLEQP